MKMKKKWALAGASIALILAGVLAGLAACQMESLSLPPELPYGVIT